MTTKFSMTSIALTAALAMAVPISGAVAEQKADPQAAYDKALNDCAQLDNPDRRQQCHDKATEQFEQAQKSGMEKGGMEKKKQY